MSFCYAAAVCRSKVSARLSTAMMAVALLGYAAPLAAQTAPNPPYNTMTDLGTLPGYENSWANAVSDDGAVIVGGASAGSGWQAFRWTAQGMSGLGTLGGADSSDAVVSGDGKVIFGTSTDSTGQNQVFRWTPEGGMQNLGSLTGGHPTVFATSENGSAVIGYAWIGTKRNGFRWTEASGMQDLGTLGGDYVTAFDISADGSVVVGDARNSANESHAYRWTESGGMQDLGTLGGALSYAFKVSRDGAVIVGQSQTAAGDDHAFRWTQATGMLDLGTLGGGYATAVGVNDDGTVIVGQSSLADGATDHAFRWTQAGGMQDLGALGGRSASAIAVSGDGSVVAGEWRDATDNALAFRWTEEDGMQDLGTLGGTQSFAYAISRDGSTIVGQSQNQDGDWRAFIYRTQMIDFTNMITSFALTASDVEALGEGQRQNLGWVLDSTCQATIGGKGCIGGAVQVMRVAADDKAVLMRRHDQGVKANVGVRLTGALTMGAGFGLFQQEDRAFSLKPGTAFHYGAWLDLAPGGTGPLGFKARLAAGGAVQGNTIERGRGLDNVELTPGRADLATLTTQGQVQYGIALGKLALIPNAGIAWQRSTLGAFTEATGDFPAQFDRTRWQTSFASLGADLSVPLGAGTRAVLGGKADFDLDGDAVTMTGTSTIPGVETVKATSLYTRKDRRGRFELGLEHLSGKLGFSARTGVHTPVIGSKPTLVFGLGFGAGF